MSAFKPVRKRPDEWTVSALIDHVKTGMKVELATIPLYFCALYSIKRDNGQWGSKARANILSVAEQEMLHLALAGNILRALDGQQSLYDKSMMPEYPSNILFEKIKMELRPGDKKNMECFMNIEAPYRPRDDIMLISIENILPDYMSIGQFYTQLKNGILEVSEVFPNLFSHNWAQQFTGAEFFNQNMTVVVSTDTALHALKTIVDQGEGNSKDPKESDAKSHYTIFREIYLSPKELPCIDYVDEPHTAKYERYELAYRLSLAVDASFCYLLQTIDRCWVEESSVKRTQLFRNIHRLMIDILSPVAHLLVEQVIEGEKHAAPCFEFYPPGSEKALSPKDLFEGLTAELTRAYEETVAGSTTQEAIAKIMFCLKGLVPEA